jgi:hypothetical protein
MDHAEAQGRVEAYLKDRLDESEREEFEAHYFACEACLDQLEAASDFREGMLQVAAEDGARAAAARAQLGLLAGLALLSRGRRMAWAGLLLLLLALPLALLVANHRGAAARADRERRIASLEAELQATRQTGAGERRRLEEDLAKERQLRAAAGNAGPQVNLPLFTLAAVRSGDETGRAPVNRLPIDPEKPSLVLAMELAASEYPAYRVSLRGESGQEIWQAGDLHPDARDALVILLPSRMLRPGPYRLTVEGGKPGGRGFAVAAYSFQVVPSR